jgi:hypothetical protein
MITTIQIIDQRRITSMATRKWSILLSVILLVAFVSCGVDGQDGKSYVAYSWVGSLQHIYSDDPPYESTMMTPLLEEEGVIRCDTVPA